MANINISKLNKFNTNTFMIHSADKKSTVSHIAFWIDTFSNSNKNFSILVRDEKSYKELTKKFPKLQICYAKAPVDVETVINAQPNLKAVFYTTNLVKNIHLLRFNHLKHIFIGIKNSEWLSQFNKSYRAYDEIWCGGEFVINRIKEEIENIGHLEFKIVGKPQLKEVLKKKNNLENNNLLILIDNKNNILFEKIYFAYYSNNKSEINLCLYLTNNIIKKDLINISKQNGFYEKIKIFDNKELLDEFATKASYIITDLINLNPYLLSYNIPIIVYIEKELSKYTIEPELLQEALYYFSDKNELLDILKNLNKGNDSLKETRENISNQFFNKEAILKDKFIKNIESCVK